MTRKEFINKYGDEPQKVTKNFATKSLGTNYDIKDAIIEFCDNAYDARINGLPLNFDIKIDNEQKMFVFCDDGTGISNDANLFKLGGTNKELDKNKIGKFGVGVAGAVSAIATKCAFDKNEIVECIYVSVNGYNKFEKHIAICPNGDMLIGETTYFKTEISNHYTRISFTNVVLNNCEEIINALEETFEETLSKNLNISFNGRQLGKSRNIKTFVGDEKPIKVKVGNLNVEVKYRIIGGESTAKEKELDESGLRIYDKVTGRLLAKDVKLWQWYADRKAQQSICGLRAAIYIEGSLESYKMFGIKSTKNGVTYRYYHKDPNFAELSKVLLDIYKKACNEKGSKDEKKEFEYDGKTFVKTDGKLDDYYMKVGPGTYLIKNKYSKNEVLELINQLIVLKHLCENKARR